MFPISISPTKSGARKAGDDCSSSALGCGIPTTRSNGYRRARLLYARSIPPVGGHTEFADERAAYDALPAKMKSRLETLVAEHSIFNSRARLNFGDFSDEERREMPPVPQVLVRTIAESRRKSLYLASHAGRIFGMPDEEGPRAHR